MSASNSSQAVSTADKVSKTPLGAIYRLCEKLEKDMAELKESLPATGGGGGGGNGSDGTLLLVNYKIDTLSGRSDKLEAKADKLAESLSDVSKTLSSIAGRIDLIEKKLPNWWQPYVGIGSVAAAIALVMHFMK